VKFLFKFILRRIEQVQKYFICFCIILQLGPYHLLIAMELQFEVLIVLINIFNFNDDFHFLLKLLELVDLLFFQIFISLLSNFFI